MKNRLLVIDGILQDIAGFPSQTLSIIQSHVPDNVLVVLDEDIHGISQFTDFSQFSSYSLISSNLDFTRVELEKYHLPIENAYSHTGIETIEDLIPIVKSFYLQTIMNHKCCSDVVYVEEPRMGPPPARSKCNAINVSQETNSTKNRFDDLFN